MAARIPPALLRRLEKAARTAAKTAYAPYSKFFVGAAVLSGSGRIYSGCNVENASYGLCQCAERTALFTAIASGERQVRAVAIFTPTAEATGPCGACRQALSEFGPEALVISTCNSSRRLESTVATLLPASFGLRNLRKAQGARRRRR
jgi:cytidine deaminase